MSKEITIAPKPNRPIADEWVNNRSLPLVEKPKRRINVEVDAEFHRRIKVACAKEGVQLSDEVRKLLEERFGANLIGEA